MPAREAGLRGSLLSASPCPRRTGSATRRRGSSSTHRFLQSSRSKDWLMGLGKADQIVRRSSAARSGLAGGVDSWPGSRSGAGSSQSQFAFQVVQGGELTLSDGGFARVNLRPILRCECLGGFVYQELQEPVRCREFLVRKQIHQIVKDFFGAHSLILTPGLRGNLFRSASLLAVGGGTARARTFATTLRPIAPILREAVEVT